MRHNPFESNTHTYYFLRAAFKSFFLPSWKLLDSFFAFNFIWPLCFASKNICTDHFFFCCKVKLSPCSNFSVTQSFAFNFPFQLTFFATNPFFALLAIFIGIFFLWISKSILAIVLNLLWALDFLFYFWVFYKFNFHTAFGFSYWHGMKT